MGNSATKENEEIIIKCTLEEMIKSFFKDYVIIWHDPNLNSQENQYFIKRLEKLYKVEPFIEWEKASKFIKETQTICHVITCGTNGEELIKEITSNDNVVHAYIFCQNKEYHTTWAQNYKKISCVETEIQNIIDQLEQNLFKWSKQVSSLKLDLPAFAPVFNDIDKSTMNHLHRYLKIIPNFKNRAEAKKDFLSLSKSIYSDPKNTGFIAEFEKDFNDYNKAQTLKWYTRESFLYKVTNNCLRIATSDSIQYCRLPLKDIEQAIKEEYQDKSKNFYGLLYRGAYISQSEWSSLKKNTDREIEMHGFLSVSQEKSVALKFLKKDASQKILITVIVPKGPNDEEQGFADIAEYSRFPKEKEILFNVRSRFTVLETEDEYSPDSPYRHLVLLYGAQGFRKFLSEENPVQDVEILDIDNISCARCKLKPQKTIFVSLEGQYYCCSECVDKINLYDPAPLLCIPILRNAEKMNRIRKVQGCFLLNSVEIDTPFYGYKCSKCQTKKQKKYLTCADCCSRENRWCENCFDDSLTCVQSEHNILFERRPFSFWCEKMSKSELNHLDYQKNLIKKDVFEQAQMHYESHQYEKAIKYFQIYIEQNENNEIDFNLMNSYNQMGFSFSIQGEYEKARNCYLKALDLIRTLDRDNYPNISICLNNIGTTYGKEGKYQAALGYHFKSLEITKSLYEENDFQVTSCYNSIAITLGKLGDFQKALEYFQKALDITKSVHGENHPRLISCYNNLASVLSQLGDNDKALDFSLKSLHMSISLHGELHHHVALNYSNIGTVYHKQGKFNKAIECYSKSLDIKRVIQNELHPEVALVYNNMGMAFYDQGEYSKALECHLKSINIQKSVYGENDLNIAFYLNGLGQVYDAQGEYKKARECYMKALDIGESVHGKLLPLVAATYNRIGMNFYYQGDHNQALEYVMISLDLWISLFGENHPDIALTYSHIGLIYYKMEEHGKAMEYYKKSLNIGKPIHGKLHPLVATAEHNLALVYISLGKYEEALEYLFESLSIKKAIYGENHREVALWYDHIGAAFGKKGEYKMALEYLVKALDINKLHLGEFHPDVAYSYGNIGAIFIYQAEYDEGLKYLFRTLEIFKFISGEYSSEVATAYSTIGVTYQKQKKFNEALEYHFKALEVFQVVFGEYHHEVAISYENIGKTYFNLYEGDHGLEYCLKSLDIRISIYGTDHPETIFLQNLISQKLNP